MNDKRRYLIFSYFEGLHFNMISLRKVQNASKVMKLFIKVVVSTLIFNAHHSQAKETSVGNNFSLNNINFTNLLLDYQILSNI